LEEELKGAAYRKVLPPFFMLSLQDTCNAIDGNDLHTDMLVNYANQVIGNSHGDTASKSDSKSTCIKLTLRDFAAFHQIWPEPLCLAEILLQGFWLSFSGVPMRYINWIFRTLLFIALLGFAVKNDQPVTLRYFFGYEWQSSLVIVLLIFFTAGAAIGVLAMFTNVLQQRREIAAFKRDIRVKNKLAGIGEIQDAPK
jgi:uncharacterized integral membrane protein